MGEIKGYVTNNDERGSVNISEEVVAIVAASAAAEVEGVHSLSPSHGKDIAQMLVKKGLSKGVRVNIDDNHVTIDVYIMADMGFAVNEVGAQVQQNVIYAVESAVGLAVGAVNVHICGIALRKDR